MKNFWIAFRMFLWMTALTGIAYPLCVTLIAQITMKRQANGDFIDYQEKTIGARLIAQEFKSNKYFWPRPSFINYNPLPSGGSNLGPTSKALKILIEDRKKNIKNENAKIPSELLFASASGLDPHISPSTARFQIERIITAREMDPKEGKVILEKLIDSQTISPRFGFLGVPCLNVLLLNIALDELNQ